MPASDDSPFDPVIERNIAALLARRRKTERQRSTDERLAAAVARFAGSMASVYAHLMIFGTWIVINRGWGPLPPFDPSFVVLAMVASVEAIFLSTFVLITQNRMAAEDERRAELDLHISLLAEHEITTLSKLLREIAAKLEIDHTKEPDLETTTHDVAPEQVLDRIEAAHGNER
jgi:uncharacterized membrane protein